MNKKKFLNVPKNCKIEIDDEVIVQDRLMIGPNCKSIKIGYGSFIGRDMFIGTEELKIGEYTTVHQGSIIQGKKVTIGHNCWFGHYTIIDGTGVCKIGNNVGAGAHSQLWSHKKFGDVLEGCKFNSKKSLIIEDDVWLVGKCIVGPITAKSKSMLLTGSYIINDMKKNSIYSGSPAKLIEKLGSPYISRNYSDKLKMFKEYVNQFLKINKINSLDYKIIKNNNFKNKDFKKGTLQFDLSNRKYLPTRSTVEKKFIKFMLYEKAKFLPFVKK